MKNYRKLLAGSLALFLAVGITGCSNTSGGGTGVANEDGLVVLNVASTNQPVSFDPADANLVVNEYTEYDCYDTLLDLIRTAQMLYLHLQKAGNRWTILHILIRSVRV